MHMSDPSEPVTYLEAIRAALNDILSEDDRTFLLGEDISTYGGAFKVTDGFRDKFGADRIIDTPIAEGGIIGTAIGAALMGRRPIVEMQFMDFISCGFNQLTNFAAKCHYRWGGAVPIIVRGPGGGLVGGGPFHSQSIEVYFAKTPGLKVLCPATVQDAYGMLRAAIDDPNPTIFIEHKALYRSPNIKAPLPPNDYRVSAGTAQFRRSGQELLLITYGALLYRTLEAAERLSKLGIEAGVLDLRSIAPLDQSAIIDGVKTYHKVLIVHEDTQTLGIAAEICALINEHAFEWLDAPVRRLTAPNTPIPYHAALEAAFAPQVDQIEQAALDLAQY